MEYVVRLLKVVFNKSGQAVNIMLMVHKGSGICSGTTKSVAKGFNLNSASFYFVPGFLILKLIILMLINSIFRCF